MNAIVRILDAEDSGQIDLVQLSYSMINKVAPPVKSVDEFDEGESHELRRELQQAHAVRKDELDEHFRRTISMVTTSATSRDTTTYELSSSGAYISTAESLIFQLLAG